MKKLLIIAVAVLIFFNLFILLSKNTYGQNKKGSFLLQDKTLPQKDTYSGQFAESIPALLYHGEGGETANTPVAVFDEQMQTLKNAGWHTVSLADLQSFLKGDKKLPAKSFLLTFDDARVDSFQGADPVLQKDGFTAVMFVITGFSLPQDGKTVSFYLNKDQLSAMQASGRWELESHSDQAHRIYDIAKTDANAATTTGVYASQSGTVPGHFMSNKFVIRDSSGSLRFETDAEFSQRIRNDLTTAKQTLTKDFGGPITAFAYPLNDFGQDSINFPDAQSLVSQIVPNIYQSAFYQTWPAEGETWNYPDQHTYMVRRIEPAVDWTGADLLAAMEAGEPKNLPYATNTFGNEWLPAWGDITSNGNSLSIRASSDSTGAEAALEGSHLWTDYTFTADASPLSNTEVSLIARRLDQKNNVSCDFSAGRVYVREDDNGTQTELTNAAYDLSSGKNTFGIQVQGNTVSCLSGQTTLVNAKITNSSLSQGGISIQVWNQTPGVAGADISRVDVEPK